MAADWTADREIWTVTEVAARLRCGASTVRGWCELGLLPALRTPGGHYRVRAADLRAFLGRPEPRSAAA